MTRDEWEQLNEYLKRRSRWYPWDEAVVEIGALRDLVSAFEDALASGEVKLKDEPGWN